MRDATLSPAIDEPLHQTPEAGDSWLVGGGEMGHLIRSMDWSHTPLGPLETWPHSLRTTVNLCLSSNFPIDILWGPESNQIYNDGYRRIVGEKHPAGMGMGFRECWESAWPEIGEPFEEAWSGKTSFIENQRMFLTRGGYLEETYFTFSLSPIRDERGAIAGLFHPVTETTPTMLSARRTRALRQLAASTGEARSLEFTFASCAQTFSAHQFDLPFVLLYSLNADCTEARLAGRSGIEAGLPASPEVIHLPRINLPTPGEGWPIEQILAEDGTVAIDDLQRRFGPFACGPYPEGANLAVGRKLQIAGSDAPFGILIAAFSPRLPFLQEYGDHLEQVAAATSTVLGNALTYERERKRAEALAELDRAKTLFFSQVSHEFRTPLTLLLGPLEGVLQEGALTQDQLQNLQISHRNGLRLLKLVNTLLDFSRVEVGRMGAAFEPTDLGAYTAELASNFRSACERAGLRLLIDCPPLPEPVYVEREMWEKIVHNLVSNAFNFTFQGSIKVTLRSLPKGVEVVVSDTGIGIPTEELPRVFERFHRVRAARGRSHEGTGIGLALVQELVRLHGGTIELESELHKGTTFRIGLQYGTAHLPADRTILPRGLTSTAVNAEAFVEEALRWTSDEPPATATADSRAVSNAGSANAERADADAAQVLVVDDNADMRDYLRRLLAGEYLVTTAANGEEALAMVRSNPPDLVLSDIIMPVLDGIGLLNILRSDATTKTIPVILLSARAGQEAKVDGLKAGADDYLVKPFAASELLARVATTLRLKRVRREADAALQVSEQRFRALSNASADVIYRMSADWSEMRRLDGRGRLADTPVPSMSWVEQYIHPDDQPLVWRTIERAVRTRGTFELEHRVRLADGSLGWTLSRAVPLLARDGQISEWIGSATDITALRQNDDLRNALGERDALLREVHHRVKNNLQVITSLLEMQARQSGDPNTMAFFEEACNRVGSIAAIHEMLYQSGTFSNVDLHAYAQRLVPYLISFYEPMKRIQSSVEGDHVHVELEKAVPCGLLLNELVSNVCKHAFPNGEAGNLAVRLARRPEGFRLTVKDTGVGLPGISNPTGRPKTLGLQLVRTLVEQLKGTVRFHSGPGCCVEVDIPLSASTHTHHI